MSYSKSVTQIKKNKPKPKSLAFLTAFLFQIVRTRRYDIKMSQVASSNINEVIRAIPSLFFFFLRKDFTQKKSTKTHIGKQKQKRWRFYALKKHLRRRKSLIHLFTFLCFLGVQKRQYLRRRKSLV